MGKRYIRNSIIKLQMQTYANLEVIYVDDGSTDQTGIILDETATEDDRFRVIHKENGGVVLQEIRELRQRQENT